MDTFEKSKTKGGMGDLSPKEKYKEYQKKYREDHKDYFKQYGYKWREENRNKILEYRNNKKEYDKPVIIFY
tara:strand:+ start:581 stop:793 length:213 start_codon:yes stop_codon:yes gene_type:complete